MKRDIIRSLFTKKLPSGALQLAVIISFIVILMCSFFIMQLYMSSRFVDEGQILTRKIHNTSSVITKTLAKLSLQNEDFIEVYNKDSVHVQVKHWGVFKIIAAEINGRYPVKQSYILGIVPDTSKAIYVANDDQYLAIAGKSIVKGKAFVPRLGIRPEYIGSIGFTGTFGKIEKSDKDLPKVNEEFEKQIIALYNLLKQPLGVNKDYTDSLCRSFFDSTIIIQNPEYISPYIRGNIVIIDNRSIELDYKNDCKDIICIAPYIRIKSGFKGSLQAFATDSIIIDSDVILENPSFLCVYRDELDRLVTPKIIIKEKAKVAGGIYFQVPELYKNYARVTIKEKAQVYGTIYSLNFVENQGEVFGTIYTKYFFAKTTRGVYKNMLYDGSIIPSKRPMYFLSTGMLKDETGWKKLKKLY